MKKTIIRGIIIHGDGMGKKLGYPTANLSWPKKRKIPKGIFAAEVRVLKKDYQGIAVIGVRSIIDKRPKLEVHILDFNRMIYGKWISAVMVKKIRNLKSFKSKKVLLKAIGSDCKKARRILKNGG